MWKMRFSQKTQTHTCSLICNHLNKTKITDGHFPHIAHFSTVYFLRSTHALSRTPNPKLLLLVRPAPVKLSTNVILLPNVYSAHKTEYKTCVVSVGFQLLHVSILTSRRSSSSSSQSACFFLTPRWRQTTQCYTNWQRSYIPRTSRRLRCEYIPV